MPEIFALGAAIGRSQRRINSLAILFSGQRSATVSSPPVVAIGTISRFGIITVSGPGMNFLAGDIGGMINALIAADTAEKLKGENNENRDSKNK